MKTTITVKKMIEAYIKYLNEFAEKIKEEDLLSLGISSISFMNEVSNVKDPMNPRMIIKYVGGTQEIIDGYENISKKLNELFEDIIKN
jgi:hypothetical protein